MRVNPGHRNTRIGVAHPLKEGIGNANHGFYPILVEGIKEFAQRDVGGDVDHLQLIGIEHHRVIFAVGEVRQQFGMAGIVMARQMQRLFVQRRGGNGFHFPRHRQLGGATHAAVGQIPRLRLYDAWL